LGFKHIEGNKIMVTLQKRSYRKNGEMYLQFRITISEKIIDSLNWKGNDKLELIIKDGTIIVKNQMKK